jgi:hypothetical protein
MRRIRLDLMFVEPSEADELWALMKQKLNTLKIKSLVTEKSYIEYEECGHDMGLPCQILQRFEK